MNLRSLVIVGLTAVTMFLGMGQAQAMNLLVAVGNPSIQLVVTEEGVFEIIQVAEIDEQQILQVSSLEPATGETEVELQR